MEPNLKNIEIEIGLVSPQLYYLNKDPAVPDSPIGSSVLIVHENRHFLITAGHVIMGKFISRIGVLIGYDFISIGGIVHVIEPNVDEDVKSNNTDLALYELDDEFVIVVKEKYKFLDINKVSRTPSSINFTRQFIFGYPADSVCLDHISKKIIPSPLRLRTVSIPLDIFEKEEVNPQKILLMYGDTQAIYRGEEKTELGRLEGISGCGVWEITDGYGTNPQYQLAGIFTAYHPGKKIFYSTRSGEILLNLHQIFKLNI